MTIALIILCALCVLLATLIGWLFGKTYRQQADIEKLYDAVASLSLENAKREDQIAQLTHDDAKIRQKIDLHEDAISEIARRYDKNREEIRQLAEKIDRAAQSQEEAAEAIARQVGKEWENGLQKMLNWNPFDRGGSGGAA